MNEKKFQVRIPLQKCLINTCMTIFFLFACIFDPMTGSIYANTENSIEQQQKKQITGTIVDVEDIPIIGANIIEVGTTNGTITDMDGNFSLEVGDNAVIRISYIGYLDQEINTSGQTVINITLQEDTQTLEEVVVVGYGTQRRVNLTGSVNSVNMSEISESRPITNISSGLAGLAAGVYVNSASNRPADDNSSILVRGQGTLNNSAPLVIVDGVESNIANVNPADIENMSILKDAASSSIYGSRAANGVILITTKKGRAGKIQLNYNGYISSQSVYDRIEPVSNYADYMELMNEGMRNSGQTAPFSTESINKWREMEGVDPVAYANNDWRKEVFRTANSQNHSISLSGGSENIRFFSSFRYMDNPGVIERAGVTRYDLRTNVEAKVKDWLSIGTNLSGGTSNTGLGTDILDDVFLYAQASTPGFVLRAPDGRYGSVSIPTEDNAQANNVLHRLNGTEGSDKTQRGAAKFYAIMTPFEGLTINGSYSYETSNRKRWSKPVFHDRWNFLTNTIASVGTGRTSITNLAAKTDRYFMDATATYEKMLFNHLDFKAMVGTSQELYEHEQFSATRQDLIDPSLSVIDAAIGDSNSSGTKYGWAMRSYFGRLNFNWNEKYLLELNLRADASSRFLRDRRWGYFPSASAGWRIDQEPFMEPVIGKTLSSLRLRASYGTLGNNALGSGSTLNSRNYDALSVYSLSNYILNDGLQLGLSQTSIANALLTWEQTYMSNFGIDMSFIDNKLSSTIDIFNKRTVGILIDLPAPLVHGLATIPKQNSATVVNNGVELSLGWRDKIKDFSYNIGGNISYIRNKVVKYKGDDYTIIDNGLIKEGHPIGAQYLLTADRLITTQQDLDLVQQIIDNAPIDPATGNPRNPFAAYGRPGLGDILYKDINGDGVINDEDRTTFGNGTNPTWMFGITLGAEYKGFDFSALIQGVADLKVYYQDEYFRPLVRGGYQINKQIADGRWYEGRETPAKYPRLLEYSDLRNMRPSSFWLTNKAYLKVRNIQLGYSLPTSLVSKADIERVRFYVSLENFFTFTSYPGIDPEVAKTNYPSMCQAVFGFNLTF